jgi:NADH:ubiquinone oxidoreductase subunit 2 (subunit N)
MLYCSFVELDALLSIIIIIVYGLFSLKSTQINLSDVFFFCRLFPLLFVLGFYVDIHVSGLNFYSSLGQLLPTIDALLAILLFFVMFNFQSFESILLLLFTFIGQYYMLHSIDLLTFYIALEAQNFCFLVLCGLPTVILPSSKQRHPARDTPPHVGGEDRRSASFGFTPLGIRREGCSVVALGYAPVRGRIQAVNGQSNLPLCVLGAEKPFRPKDAARGGGVSFSRYNNVFSVEAAIKYFLLSAFSSGVLLFWFSAIYLQTGMSILSFTPKDAAIPAFDHVLQCGAGEVKSAKGSCADIPSGLIQTDVGFPPRGGETPTSINGFDLSRTALPHGDSYSFLNSSHDLRGLHLGASHLNEGVAQGNITTESISVFLILCAMMFKLGAAPLHLWVVQIYNGVTKNLLLYISTAPKLSLFGFWVNSFQTVWTDYSIVLFSVFSIILGAFGAYSQPSLRSVLSYSTINEIGLLLSALETAGFNSLFQHLSIYVISQLLLWNLTDKRLFTILAVSLAGLPPLAGFYGKAWVFWQVGTVGLTSLLLIALFCTAVSLVYYIRIIRLFWNPNNSFSRAALPRGDNVASYNLVEQRIQLTSACVILLFILPIFIIKPFII